MSERRPLPGSRALVFGLGVTGQAVARALIARGHEVVAADDRRGPETQAAAAQIGVDVLEAPTYADLAALAASVDMVLPGPGVPDRHELFAIAADVGVPILSEFDLAAAWDARPIVAITGTDGKTTVTTMTAEAFTGSGRRALAVGNTDVPLVAALDDSETEVFVVEASSFRLFHSQHFAPVVATWLNFAPDHLDNHRSLDAYEAAKARIWAEQGAGAVAVGNADDSVVARHLAAAPAERHVSFGTADTANWRSDGETIRREGEPFLRVDELWRALPHDVSNAMAVAATVLEASDLGGDEDAVRDVLRKFTGLHHRVERVGEAGGVTWYDDSKSTTPHATLAALAGFDSVVLVAGGRNKGLDLRALAEAAPRIRAVVAIGEAAAEVEEAFAAVRPVDRADSMDEAVRIAASRARRGDAVLLSPACASFDWYGNYAERGDDFVRAARDIAGVVA